jgi:holo-[acyl-carrier protein] synthase
MKILVGIDIQSIDDVEASIVTFGDRYVERVYTPFEIESCSVGSQSFAANLADRFAAKEAVMKILDVSDTPMPWKSIEIQVNLSGGSAISLSGAAAERAERRGVDKISVSLSHAERVATAVVVAEIGEHDSEDGDR